MLIQINSSDHNPAVVPGAKPGDSWELNTPWLKQYYVNSGGKKGFIMSNSNFVALPWANDLEAFTIALAQSIAGSVQRDMRFPDTFFTVISPSDVLAADVLAKAAPQAASYTISDLMAEVQQLANPIPAQGNALVRNVEDMENFTRQKVARARLAVDNAFRLVAQESLSAAYWMNVRARRSREAGTHAQLRRDADRGLERAARGHPVAGGQPAGAAGGRARLRVHGRQPRQRLHGR